MTQSKIHEMQKSTYTNSLTSKNLKKPFYRILEGDNKEWFHKLDHELTNQIQLIYLDPPYNTKRFRGARKIYSDTNYQWSDMMRTILVKSHNYLKDSGFLIISINQMEMFNLKNIADEFFKNGFIGVFPIKIRHPERQLMINATFHNLFEYLLVFRKNKTSRFYSPRNSYKKELFCYEVKINEKHPIKKKIGGSYTCRKCKSTFDTRPLNKKNKIECTKCKNSEFSRTIKREIEIYKLNQYEIIKGTPSIDKFRKYLIAGKIATANWSGEVYEEHLRTLGKDKLIKVYGLEKKGLGYRWFITGNHKRNSGIYFQSTKTAGRPNLYDNFIDCTDIVTYTNKEGGIGCDFKDSKKPEILLNQILDMTTKKNDLVMDFFGGSGTTLASCIKKNRSCILIENAKSALDIIYQRLENMKCGKDIDKIKYGFKNLKSLKLSTYVIMK